MKGDCARLGRTTVEVLNMNEASRVKLRRELLDLGEPLEGREIVGDWQRRKRNPQRTVERF